MVPVVSIVPTVPSVQDTSWPVFTSPITDPAVFVIVLLLHVPLSCSSQLTVPSSVMNSVLTILPNLNPLDPLGISNLLALAALQAIATMATATKATPIRQYLEHMFTPPVND